MCMYIYIYILIYVLYIYIYIYIEVCCKEVDSDAEEENWLAKNALSLALGPLANDNLWEVA